MTEKRFSAVCLWGEVFIYHFCVCEEEKKEELESYITVTIDTKHKVSDHYSVHEKLGV